MFEVLAVIAAIGLLFGIGYPVAAVIVYPIYRLITGDSDFFQYLRNL